MSVQYGVKPKYGMLHADQKVLHVFAPSCLLKLFEKLHLLALRVLFLRPSTELV